MTPHFKSARALYHHWMKKFGDGAGFHEGEMVNDINRFAGDRVRETDLVTLEYLDRLFKKLKLWKRVKK